MSAERIHLTVTAARELAERALGRIGYDAEEARILANHMLDAAHCGYEYSGLPKILNIPEHARFTRPRRAMRIIRETEVSTIYDGGNNIGMLVIYHAAEAAIEKAAKHGFALVGVTNTWMSGRSACFVEMIARVDLIALHTVSCSRAVAPLGGTKPIFSATPIAFGLPSADGPRHGYIGLHDDRARLRERLGQPLPKGVALDPDGQPTRDPRLGRLGALLPFGRHKGFGLAFIIQALGLVAGSALDPEQDNGYLFVVFDPGLLVPRVEFKRQLSELITRVKAIPCQAGVAEIRIPSERAFRSRERLLREGIEVDSKVYDALNALLPAM